VVSGVTQMRFSNTKFIHVVPLVLVSFLVACGGGGGGATGTGNSSSNTPSPQSAAGTAHYFAYILRGGISTYSINAETGALTAVAGPTGTNQTGFAVHPSGKFAYGINDTTDISTYTVSTSNGALTALGAPFAPGPHPHAFAVHPSGQFAYVANGLGHFGESISVSGFAIDPGTGALTSLGAPVSPAPGHGTLFSLVMAPSGRFVYITTENDTVVTLGIDVNAGVLSLGTANPIADLGLGTNPGGFTVAPNGKFAYFVHDSCCPSGTAISAFTVDQATGALAAIGDAAGGAFGSPRSIIVDSSSAFLYVPGGDSILAYTINPTTGALTPVGGTVAPDGRFPRFLTSDPTGRFAYVPTTRINGNVTEFDLLTYSVDANTGSLILMGEPVAINADYMITARTIE